MGIPIQSHLSGINVVSAFLQCTFQNLTGSVVRPVTLCVNLELDNKACHRMYFKSQSEVSQRDPLFSFFI